MPNGESKSLKRGCLVSFFGEGRSICGDMPINAKRGVNDANTTICLWMIEIVTLVLGPD